MVVASQVLLFLPSSHGTDKDGIVLEAEFMGSSNANSSVLIHEMGHYLGLYHTFRQGCANSDCLGGGDKVCDTPPDQSTVAVPCNGSVNSCSTDVDTTDSNNPFTTDQNDMFWNYLDYGDWNCTSAFTSGQTARMDYFTTGVRASLLESKGCLPPCLIPITASFNASDNQIDIGSTVNFTNTSTGSLNQEWLIDGIPFSTNTNTTYNFLEEGEFVITPTGDQ